MSTNPLSQIVVVSSRLPLTYDSEAKSFRPSSGGLVSALQGVNWEGRVHWVGSLGGGSLVDTQSEPFITQLPGESSFNFTAVELQQELYDSYYNGFCNGVLWPLFHYQTERVSYRHEDWENYIRVNEVFCQKILDSTTPRDMIWVHDYHLFLLPAMLKKVRPQTKVGFFLHIPFPSSEIYRQLPPRSDLLKGMLAADLVGFHDYNYLRHFCSSVYSVLGISSSLLSIETEGHNVDLGVFPVSVDTAGLSQTAYSDETEQVVTQLLSRRKPGHQVVLGVDRLDYTKGLDLKLNLFERLLEKHPDLVGKVELLKLVVPSRVGNQEYEKFKYGLEQRIAEINGKFSSPGYSPVNYIFGSVRLPELLALYRTSDVLLVTSQRDGMNMVCLEYVAVQDRASPGAVVLSEFAGAASTLSHAFKINPWDSESSSDVLYEALRHPLEKRQSAFSPMFQFLEKYTATTWAASFIKRLVQMPGPSQVKSPKPLELAWEELEGRLSRGPLLLLLDYDGVLVPLVDRPEEALPEKRLLELLTDLQRRGAVRIIVVSGRSASFLESVFGLGEFYLASNHGAKNYDPQVGRWVDRGTSQKGEWYLISRGIMNDFVARTPGSFLEEKEHSIVWHDRSPLREFGVFQSRKLFAELESALSQLPVQVSSGKRIIEVKAAWAHKGSFVRWLKERGWIGSDQPVLCLGDDLTDEDMFKELGEPHITVHVGRAETQARYFLDHQGQVAPFLERLLQMRQPGRASLASP